MAPFLSSEFEAEPNEQRFKIGEGRHSASEHQIKDAEEPLVRNHRIISFSESRQDLIRDYHFKISFVPPKSGAAGQSP